MAQADSVPSAIRPPLTGARSNPSTKSRFAGVPSFRRTTVFLARSQPSAAAASNRSIELRPEHRHTATCPKTMCSIVSNGFPHSIDDLINQLVLGHDEAALIGPWQEMVVPSENPTQNPNTRWHHVITGPVPVSSYALAVCYATAVIYLGCYPWNFLLGGVLFLIRNNSLHERALVWCSSRVRMLIGLAVNSMKATFALSESRR